MHCADLALQLAVAHLHVHVVPRWSADTNFMTTVSHARVLPMTLTDAWTRLRAVWPEPLEPVGSTSIDPTAG